MGTKKKENKWETVRLHKAVMDSVREYLKNDCRTIGGFISMEIGKVVDKLQAKNKEKQ